MDEWWAGVTKRRGEERGEKTVLWVSAGCVCVCKMTQAPPRTPTSTARHPPTHIQTVNTHAHTNTPTLTFLCLSGCRILPSPWHSSAKLMWPSPALSHSWNRGRRRASSWTVMIDEVGTAEYNNTTLGSVGKGLDDAGLGHSVNLKSAHTHAQVVQSISLQHDTQTNKPSTVHS